MTKSELRQYKYIVQEIEVLEEEIERTRAKLENPGGYLRIETIMVKGKKHGALMPHSNNYTDKIGTLVAELVDLLSDCEEQYKKLSDKRKDIEEAIGCLEYGEARLIKARYIEDKPWEQIADEMKYSIRQVYRLHKKTLEKMSPNVT